MQEPCEHCPLVGSHLFDQFCGKCRQKTDGHGVSHRFHALGIILYQDGFYDEAAAAFRAAIKHANWFMMESGFDLTLCLLRLSRYEEALEAINEVLEHHQQGDSYYLKGLTLRYLKRYDEAEASLKEAESKGYEKAATELDELRVARDIDYLDSGDLPEDPEKRLAYVVGRLSGMESIETRHEVALLSRAGDAARDMGDFDVARRYYISACQKDLTPETSTQLAEFVLDFGGEDEAEEIAETWLHQALDMNDQHGRAHLCLGRMQWNRGELERAFHSMLSAVRACPTDEYVLFETAELAAEIGNIPYCLALIRRLQAVAKDDHYWLDRARSLCRSIGVY
jgi:tetratricopeptide (TPR) repeat protein